MRKAAVEALEALARLRSPADGGSGGILTVGDWLAHWLVSRTSRPHPRSAVMPLTSASTSARTGARCC